MEILLTNSVTDLASRRPPTRTPEEIGQLYIGSALGHLADLNGAGRLSGIIYIGVSKDGDDHIMGLAGEDDFMSPIDMASILELHKQSILLANGYVET